jgi:general secretion pathway protein F
MGAYEYTALDNKGKNVRGILHGDTAKQIRQLLRDQNLIPLNVDETSQTLAKTNNIGGFQRFHTNDLILFTRQLATMVQAGEPLDAALKSIADEFSRPFSRKIIHSIRSALLEGQDLAGAMSQYKRQFPDFYIATISAGEHSGKLGNILERLADYIEYRQQHQQQMLLSLLYPAIVISVALLVVIALMTYVVPQVIHIYEDMDQQLPLLTRLLIGTSEFLRDNILFLLIATLITLVISTYLYRLHEVQKSVHQIILRLPLVGRLSRNIQIARFSRTLSILLMSSVEIVEAITVAANVVYLIPIKERITLASQKVREGVSVRKSLGETGDFQAMSLQLIASGENSGRLDDMLERSADNQEREIQLTLNTLLGLFEPLLILFMGGVVLVIVLAILLPIFDLNQMVSL